MARGRELQIVGAATAKLQEPRHVKKPKYDVALHKM